jgi:hypothetical protein
MAVGSSDSPAIPPRGTIVRLRPQLTIPGGRYKVLSTRGDRIKLRQGSKHPIELMITRFRELVVDSPDERP